MKVECENLSERKATPELIRELIRDDMRRGEFMILMQDADEEAFVQIAGDYEDVGGENDGCFDLEYRDGASSLLYHANRWATAYFEKHRFFGAFFVRYRLFWAL